MAENYFQPLFATLENTLKPAPVAGFRAFDRLLPFVEISSILTIIPLRF
jgi:hypothetical protein